MPRVMAVAVVAVTLGAVLAGCSDLYFARRDTIALGAGDAIAANEAEEIADPWPTYSGNVNIPANGQVMQSAIERYRTNKVALPVDSQASNQQQQQQQTVVNNNITAPTSPTSPTATTSAQ